jgi:hypothetical protein
MEEKMKKLVCIVMALVTVNTFSFGQTKESQVEKFARLLEELESKLVKDANGEISSESLDNGLHPVTISSISEITEKNLVEAGKPYFYKIKAIYKGADREAKRIVIQDVNSDNLLNDNFLLSITNSISSVRDAGDLNEESLKRLPKESNSIATFYICAVRIDDVSREWAYWITKVRDITPCPLKNENFILSNGLSFITPDSVFAQTDQNTMAKMLLGESASNTNIFDPLSYRFVDMMDARGAMNKKKVSDDRTFPRIPVLFEH